jgi:hypothetical protein
MAIRVCEKTLSDEFDLDTRRGAVDQDLVRLIRTGHHVAEYKDIHAITVMLLSDHAIASVAVNQ